jgi:hypothetical protein
MAACGFGRFGDSAILFFILVFLLLFDGGGIGSGR